MTCSSLGEVLECSGSSGGLWRWPTPHLIYLLLSPGNGNSQPGEGTWLAKALRKPGEDVRSRGETTQARSPGTSRQASQGRASLSRLSAEHSSEGLDAGAAGVPAVPFQLFTSGESQATAPGLGFLVCKMMVKTTVSSFQLP